MSDISQQQQQQHLWDLVKKGEYEIVCSIIKGAPHVVKWTDSRGQSPLILSCVYGHVAIAKLFLDHGGDFYKKAHSGASAWSSCIYPADREVLERHAYDVSPDGAAAIAREKAAQDRRNEKNERDCMQGEEDYMFDFLEMERILYEQFMYDQMCSRYHFVNGCVVKATERIFFAQYCNAEMAIQDEESQQREDYDKYYDYKMQRFSDLKQLRVEAERERIRQENIRRAEAERLRLLREAEAEAERLRLEEEARLAEEARLLAIKLAKIEETRQKHRAWVKQQEYYAHLHGVRAIEDRPRLTRLFKRMRLAVHMTSGQIVEEQNISRQHIIRPGSSSLSTR